MSNLLVSTGHMIFGENKTKVVKDHATHKTDTGSPQVQVALATARISELTAHLRSNKHDYSARRALLQLVGKRKRQLKYLAARDGDAYLKLIKSLGIRR